jgi:hypothetical protein
MSSSEDDIRVRNKFDNPHHLVDRDNQNVRTKWEYVVQLEQIPVVLECLRRSGQDESWVVFMFYTPIISEQTSDNALNLQYSVLNGELGLDWVLLGDRNCCDEDKLTAFIERQGYKVQQCEMNGVPFLRVSGNQAQLARLGRSIIDDFYRKSSDEVIGLLFDGFAMPALNSLSV